MDANEIAKIANFLAIYGDIRASGRAERDAILEAVKSSGIDSNIALELAIKQGIDPNDPNLRSIKQAVANIQEAHNRAQAEAIASKGREAIEAILKDTSIDSTEAIRRIRDESADALASTSSLIEAFDPEPSWDEIVRRYITKSEGYRPRILEGLIFPYSTISYIGARTSRGKTTAMISLAIDALRQDKQVIFITLEEPPTKIQRRLVMCQAYSAASDQDRKALLTECYNRYPNEKGSPLTAYNALVDMLGKDNTPDASPFTSGLIFPDAITSAWKYIRERHNDSRLSIYDATVHCDRNRIRDRLLKASEGDIVLFDYIQRTHGTEGEGTDTDIMRIRKASDMLIEVSQARKSIVIAGAQFNRSSTGQTSTSRQKASSKESNDTFSESSFKDCGDIEQDATIAIGIGWHRDKDGVVDEDRFYEILKNREGGGVGKQYTLDFHGEYSYMASKGKREKQADGGGEKEVKSPNTKSRKSHIVTGKDRAKYL